jgi:hypothetical protein
MAGLARSSRTPLDMTCNVAWGDFPTAPQGPHGGYCRTASKKPGFWSLSTDAITVRYGKGSYGSPQNSAVPGGAQFYVQPFGPATSLSRATLQYEVRFDPSFDWGTKDTAIQSLFAGKLPGLRGASFAGSKTSPECSGSEAASGRNCWSLRIMWRDGGRGEVYAYIPTTANKALCTTGGGRCGDARMSIGRGTFTFRKGVWHRIALSVVMNSGPGRADGKLRLVVDGQTRIDADKVYYGDGMAATDIMFSTFFGGSSSYASKTDTSVAFRGFRLTED